MFSPGVVRPAALARHLLAAALLCAALSGPAQADVSFGFFYSNLGPHGSWLASAHYGHVWQPAVYAPGWHPYYDGHWVYTDLGWAWVSDYSWGGIPYHYGTWVLDPYLGWVWVPGYVWAPAWVVFSTGPDHIGWCPVPVGYSIGAALTFGDLPSGGFVFVGTRDFLAPRIRVRAVPASRTKVVLARTKIVNRITVRNDVVVNPGPDVRMVEKARGRTIKAVPIERVDRIAPAGMRREQLQVDEKVRGRGLRAAEPRLSEGPAPAARRSRDRLERSQEGTVRRDGTVRRHDTPGHSADRRERSTRREGVARLEALPRRDATGERPTERQVSPKRRPDGQQVARPEEKAKKKPDRKPPARKPNEKEKNEKEKEEEARGGGGRRGSR